jgi:8-oxo-dGTP pyrophosphatase MutT (NUDIX family)
VQGGWEDDETVEAGAMRETVEEAGVRGDLEVRVVTNTLLVAAPIKI